LQEVARGLESIKRNSTIEDVIASLAGALINISFLQVGFMPRRKGQDVKITLRKENWDLSLYRSVIYLQSPDQLERKFWSEQQREMGFQNQIDLHYEYKASKSELPYSEWCASNEKA
jgi:threonine dehydratase